MERSKRAAEKYQHNGEVILSKRLRKTAAIVFNHVYNEGKMVFKDVLIAYKDEIEAIENVAFYVKPENIRGEMFVDFGTNENYTTCRTTLDGNVLSVQTLEQIPFDIESAELGQPSVRHDDASDYTNALRVASILQKVNYITPE